MLSSVFFALVITYKFKVLLTEDKIGARLIHLQILFRHGDRAPIIPDPTDPNSTEYWPEGLGKLTMVTAFSSEIDRCIRSAQMNLASFYEPTSNWTVEEHLKWQPIPIQYLPKKEDKYLYPRSYCPRATKENLATYALLEQYINDTYKDLFQNLNKHTDSTMKNFEDLLYFYDTMFIKKIYNLTIPNWIETYMHALGDAVEKYFLWYSKSTILQTLRAGPFLERVTKMMEKKQNRELPAQKVHLYSSHDAVVATVLSALHLYNERRPPYCASLIFELHEGIDRVKLVRILYLNSTTPEIGEQKIHILKLKGCSEFCSLEYFINYTKHIIPKNWEQECLIVDESPNSYCGKSLIIWILTVALLLSLIINAFLLWKKIFLEKQNCLKIFHGK